MKQIKAQKEFTSNGKYFSFGKQIELEEIESFKELVTWNEKGFIEPLTRKDLMEIKSKLENPTKKYKEE